MCSVKLGIVTFFSLLKQKCVILEENNIMFIFHTNSSYYCCITNHLKCSDLNDKSAVWVSQCGKVYLLFHMVLAVVSSLADEVSTSKIAHLHMRRHTQLTS